MYKRLGKQYTYMHQVVYNNKLERKCTLILLNPRPLYICPIRAKGHPSIRNICRKSYSSLSILYVLCLTACDAAGHLSVLCSVMQFLTHTMQCLDSFKHALFSFSRGIHCICTILRLYLSKLYSIVIYLGHQTNISDF